MSSFTARVLNAARPDVLVGGGWAIPLVAAASVPVGAAGDECGGARPPACLRVSLLAVWVT
jgi:hypothetical protein